MIQDGSKVTMHYTLTVDGEVVDSSRGGDAFIYVHGESQIVPGLEAALVGLVVGTEKDVEVPPEGGYGLRIEEAVQQVPREAFQDPTGLEVGSIVAGEMQGRPFQAMVVEVGEAEIRLDLNHPLAGKTLSFQVEIVAID